MARAEQTAEFAPDLSSVRAGRHFVRDVLQAWGLVQLSDDAQLAVSELVTNAVTHAGTSVAVSVRLADELTVVVHDGAARLPIATRTTPAATDAGRGRGLRIVEAVSDSWGVSAAAGGKSVWFALQLPGTESGDAEVLSLHRQRGTHEQPGSARFVRPASGRSSATN